MKEQKAQINKNREQMETILSGKQVTLNLHYLLFSLFIFSPDCSFVLGCDVSGVVHGCVGLVITSNFCFWSINRIINLRQQTK